VRLTIVAFCICMSLSAVASGPVYPDAGLWNTLNVNYRYNKRVSFLFTQELRLRENYTRLNLLYTNLGASYTLGKRWKASLIVRHIDKFLIDNTFSYRNRLMTDLAYKIPVSKFELSVRQRFQFEWRDFYTSPLGKFPEIFSRTKLELSFEVSKKIAPFISTEFRAQITDPRNSDDDDNLGRNRTIFGVDYTLNKTVKLGSYFLHQREFNTITPQIINILGLECNVNLNRLLHLGSTDGKAEATGK
jgi:hypothetical protein